jgi:hypothetical protein
VRAALYIARPTVAIEPLALSRSLMFARTTVSLFEGSSAASRFATALVAVPQFRVKSQRIRIVISI